MRRSCRDKRITRVRGGVEQPGLEETREERGMKGKDGGVEVSSDSQSGQSIPVCAGGRTRSVFPILFPPETVLGGGRTELQKL